MTVDPDRPIRSAFANGSRWLVLAFGFMIAVSVMAIGLGVYLWVQPEPFDPWGEFPPQTINEPVMSVVTPTPDGVTLSTVDLPTVSLSEKHTVNVTGTKCVTVDEAVQSSGEVTWTFVDPPGGTWTGPESLPSPERTLAPGCPERSFINDIPAEVIERAERRFAEGREAVIVNIAGRNTAYTDDGDKGETAHWSTQNFALVP